MLEEGEQAAEVHNGSDSHTGRWILLLVGVIYVAGEAFFVKGLDDRGNEGKNTLRLCFSAPSPERIQAGVSRLAATLRAEAAAVATTAGAAGRGTS